MNHYDPLAQRYPAKTMGYRPSAYTNADAGRSDYYGMPNMGGPPVHRKNETPSREGWYSRVVGRGTDQSGGWNPMGYSGDGDGDDGYGGMGGVRTPPYGGGKPPRTPAPASVQLPR
jgi:hypothetical protein